ncbi:dTDP-D-glucose-4%2C6-dehydratase [Yersinia frederiksenii]|uniref:NAD-dependent epimerase/dehydratase family protein n=1 Tax=Yersinia frederiksenii TaxID=29484 RepID=UPI0005DEF8AB|nr:NAD-dependent epimerase/dehydratase family protein [Yersinia frederiksenii]CNC72729.1 dTDP-D-glucose-4%2C6-dehydratase [Yersinia frederiksenii]
MESKKDGILITGGAGFIGKSLIREMLNRDLSLVSLDISDKPDTLPTQSEDFKWLKFSYLDACKREQELKDIVKDNNIKTVIHLAATMFPAESQNNLEKDCFENVYSNVCFFSKMYDFGCEKIIFASSGGTVYGKSHKVFHEDDKFAPTISYGVSKAITETYLRFLAKQFNKKSISFRISNPYGGEQKLEGNHGVVPIFLNGISGGKPINIIGSLESKRDYLYINDLIAAFMKAIYYEGIENVFNIGSGNSISLRSLIDLIEGKLHKKALIASLESNILNSEGISLNIDKAKKELNWQPSVSLDEGVDKLIKLHGYLDNE